MNTVKITCVKTLRHPDGRVWLEDETYEMQAREWATLKAELGDKWAAHFAE